MPGPYRTAARERRPGNSYPCQPYSVSISPSVGRGAPPRRDLPSPPAPGQTVGGGVPDAPRRLAPPPFPGLLPAETCAAANTPRRGQDPSLRTEPLTPAYANPRAGHARPLPRGGPGTGVRVNPTAFPYPPIRRAGCPHPAAASRRRQQQPLPSPLGEGGPAGPDEGRPSVTAHSWANRRGRRPRRPAKPPVNTHPPGNHPRRGQDPSLRAEPLTAAPANLRAGHARPLPRNNPTHLYTT